MKKKFENVESALAYQRELSDKLGVVENDLLNREMTDEDRAAAKASKWSTRLWSASPRCCSTRSRTAR